MKGVRKRKQINRLNSYVNFRTGVYSGTLKNRGTLEYIITQSDSGESSVYILTVKSASDILRRRLFI